MATLRDCITFNPKQCGGRPCVRGMRIRVSDVLDLFATGLDAAQILDEMPDLEVDDLKACLTFARRRVDYRGIPIFPICSLSLTFARRRVDYPLLAA